jgi:hypothetical protein
MESVSRATEIQRLHVEIWAALRSALEKALRVDKLLAEQKVCMESDEWLPWVIENCPFAEQTARDDLRKVLFGFTQDMGKTIIDIEMKLDQLLINKAWEITQA